MDLIQGFRFKSCAQENLDKHLRAIKYTQKSKTCVFILPNSDTPGIGLDTPDPFARSVRVLFTGWKIRVARSLRAYTRSLRGNCSPNGYFWVKGYKYSLPSFSSLSLAIPSSWTPPKAKRELSHSPLFILEWFLWGFWVRSKQEQGFVLVSLIPTSWALGFGLARGFKFVTLGVLCS